MSGVDRLYDGIFGRILGLNFRQSPIRFEPHRPTYRKNGPTTAQAKRAAIKARNRAKHRRACRGG